MERSSIDIAPENNPRKRAVVNFGFSSLGTSGSLSALGGSKDDGDGGGCIDVIGGGSKKLCTTVDVDVRESKPDRSRFSMS